MKFSETSSLYSLNKSTYVNLRWIAYIGQISAILVVQFFLKFNFNYIICISIVLFDEYSMYALIVFVKDYVVTASHRTEKRFVTVVLGETSP